MFRRRFGGNAATNGVITFETETDTLVSEIVAQGGGTPTDARKVVINSLIRELKSAGVWSSLDLFYVLAAADSTTARINWVAPSTYLLSAVNSPTFTTDRGYAGNGTTARLDTGWTPSSNAVNFTQNSASMWVWCNTDGQTAGADVGNVSVAPTAYLYTRSNSDLAVTRLNDSSTMTASSSSSIGFFGTQRRASNDRRLWRNGAQIGTTSGSASTGLPTQSLWICGANSGWFTTKQYAFFAAGAALSGKEKALHDAVHGYLTAVGAI